MSARQTPTSLNVGAMMFFALIKSILLMSFTNTHAFQTLDAFD